MHNQEIPPEYHNLDEKKEFFTQIKIKTEKDFKKLFEVLLPQKEKKGGVWRGLRESRWKLYNTFQIDNLKSKTPTQNVIKFIDKLVEKLNIWDKRDVIGKYFKNYGIKSVPIFAKLSILRHNKVPSPLLDWTRNPRVALYFATLDQNSTSDEDRIDNYFSIYFLDREHSCVKTNTKTGTEFFTSNNPKIILKRLMAFKRFSISKDKINRYFNDERYIYDDILNHPIQRIDDSENELVNHYTMSNYNITAQEGLFILNAYPFMPLEEAIFNRIYEQHANKTHKVNIQIERAIPTNLENFICFDIHKRFIPKIIEALKSEKVNITKDTMEPDFKRLKDEITFEKITKNIRQNDKI